MTDKEFKRLSRSQLIEIIYQLQLKQEELTSENERLSKELADRRILLDRAGNIANAALEIHSVMKNAQEAATHYVEEIKARVDEEKKRILDEANKKAAEIIAGAKQQAEENSMNAEKENPDCDFVLQEQN